jgi:hypothetical protein
MEFIAVELVLVFGSVLAFAWWQLRDLDREKEKRENNKRNEQKARQKDTGDAP